MIDGKPDSYFQLTATQKRVFDVIWDANGDPVSTPEICARTLLSPDVVVKVTAVLVQHDLIEVVDPDEDESELEVELVGAAR